MKFFVAGITGAIGRPLVRQLLDSGHEVTAMTRRPERADALEHTGAKAMVVDVYHSTQVREANLLAGATAAGAKRMVVQSVAFAWLALGQGADPG
jgi:uncharacterized protein YbjT (DUF2867 family)